MTASFPIELVSDDVRKELDDKISEINDRCRELGRAGKLTAEMLAGFDAQQSAILEPHDLHVAGWCEFCDRLLFAGENGSRDREGVMLCEECSPTYGDWKADLDSGLYDDDEEVDVQRCLAEIQEHIDGGGSLSDKMVKELDAE